VCYYLKLKLLEQLLAFNKEKGMTVFDALVSIEDKYEAATNPA